MDSYDASINDEIDRLAATSALVSRRDVIVVASVSCIYGLGSPRDYLEMIVSLRVGESVDRDEMLMRLIDIQYDRNDYEPTRGKFRVRGDVIEIWPAYEEFAYRIELWGDVIERLSIINPLTGEEAKRLEELYIYPAKHFVMPQNRVATTFKNLWSDTCERERERESKYTLRLCDPIQLRPIGSAKRITIFQEASHASIVGSAYDASRFVESVRCHAIPSGRDFEFIH